MKAYYCHFVFYFLIVLCFYYFFFLCVSIYLFRLVVFYDNLLTFPLITVLCLCSRFSFCGYHEVCIKCLLDKTVHFMLITYLHFSTHVLSFFFSPFYIFVVPFLCYVFITKLPKPVRLWMSDWL